MFAPDALSFAAKGTPVEVRPDGTVPLKTPLVRGKVAVPPGAGTWAIPET